MPLLLSIRNNTALLKAAKQHQTLNKKPSRKGWLFVLGRLFYECCFPENYEVGINLQ